jgi:sugar phosphate isomerase/epimerase
MRLGAPVFAHTDDPDQLAQAHRALGLRAAYCPPVKLGETDRLRAIEQAYAKHDVVIAEVGVWNNLMEPDEEKRRANVKAMCDGLALADEVGALCVVNIAGTYHPDNWAGPHPNNLSQEAFDLVVATAREIIDEVKPRRAKFTYEMMPWSLPDSADSYLALLRAIQRPQFAVHLDVVNIICSVRRYFYNADLIRECFAKLGAHIVCCHLKDTLLSDELTTHLSEARPGAGTLDIATFLRETAKLPHQPPILLEHLPNAEEYDLARRHVLEVAKQVGVDFEK